MGEEMTSSYKDIEPVVEAFARILYPFAFLGSETAKERKARKEAYCKAAKVLRQLRQKGFIVLDAAIQESSIEAARDLIRKGMPFSQAIAATRTPLI